MYYWLPLITRPRSVAKGGRSEIFFGTFVDLIETLAILVVSLEALLEVAIVVESLNKIWVLF